MTSQFGTFEFDDRSLELRRSGRVVPIEPQPARALALLVRRANDVVTREELRLAVWGTDTHVDFDRGLAYCLSRIRQALGDKGENPRFVQTLPKRGYCFIAPVRFVANEPARAPADEPPSAPSTLTGRAVSAMHSPTGGVPLAASAAPAGAPADPSSVTGRALLRRWLWWTGGLAAMLAVAWMTLGGAGAAPPTVIAVSVFDNETGDGRYDRVVSNITDAVVTQLTALAPAQVAVIGNADVLRRPRNIRNLNALTTTLRADYVILGQLQRTDAGLRFITHFVRLPDQTHLQANRLPVTDGDESALERAVVAEFERCVRTHALTAR